jgi:hypothetical protein
MEAIMIQLAILMSSINIIVYGISIPQNEHTLLGEKSIAAGNFEGKYSVYFEVFFSRF